MKRLDLGLLALKGRFRSDAELEGAIHAFGFSGVLRRYDGSGDLPEA